jgi:cytochrome c biogenesis protein CcmG, thiol:disulfide interchange protein DsbE
LRPFILFLLLPALLAACAYPSFLNAPAPDVGAPAPDFTALTPQGEPVKLSELRGQVVLINFWATWCAPCRVEMPAIQARYNRGGFSVLAIDFDERAELVQAFVNDLGLSFPVLLDPGGEIQNLYRVRGYPTSFFIDADGIIRVLHIGDMSQTELDDYLSQLGVQP